MTAQKNGAEGGTLARAVIATDLTFYIGLLCYAQVPS